MIDGLWSNADDSGMICGLGLMIRLDWCSLGVVDLLRRSSSMIGRLDMISWLWSVIHRLGVIFWLMMIRRLYVLDGSQLLQIWIIIFPTWFSYIVDCYLYTSN